MIAAWIGSTAFVNAVVLAGVLGWVSRDGGAGLFAILFATTLLAAAGGGRAVPTAGSMMADVAQEHEFLTGRSLQGVLFAAISTRRAAQRATNEMPFSGAQRALGR